MLVLALVVSGGLCVATLMAWAAEARAAGAAEQALADARAGLQNLQAANDATTATQAALPAFSSAMLLADFRRVGAAHEIELDEVSFSLEETGNVPYLRYRVRFSLSETYPVIRQFVNQLRSELPHVTLDGLSCAREGIVTPELDCDLSLSAFYRKAANG